MNVIIIPPPVKSEPQRCPHCKEILPEPEVTFIGIILAVCILGYGLLSVVSFGGEMYSAKHAKCEPLGSKRLHYILPAPILGCAVGRWLYNKEQIFEDKRF